MEGLNLKPSPILPEFYLVSDCGKVIYHPKGLVKQLYPTRQGYLCVRMPVGNVTKNIRLHRLVALTWLPNPNNYKEVNHIDCDKTNNHVSNLEWCSRTQNQRHAINNIVFNRPTKKIIQMNLAGEVIKEWESTAAAAKALNRNKSAITKTLREPHKRHTYAGFKWKYA